jgi:flagellar protein FlbD
MISLTRLNHDPVVVNADLIVLIESNPDTVLKLTTGEFVRVLESREEVVERVIDFRRRLLAEESLRAREFAYALQ